LNLLHDAPLWARLLLAVLLLAAAVQDIVQRRIANMLCLAVMLLAVAAAVASGATFALWQNGLLFALLILLSLPAFAAGWLGGGDVKLLAAVGLWASLGAILPLLAAIFIAGGVIAILSLSRHLGGIRRDVKSVPYGVAIAIGTAIVLIQPDLFDSSRAPSPLDLKAARAALRS
jgi:prepilin peptidase CpaA